MVKKLKSSDSNQVSQETLAQFIAESRERQAGIEQRLEALVSAMSSMDRKVSELSDLVDRQSKRLAAIESLPPYPLSQPGRYHATEMHSVSMARRVRLGHLG